MWDVYITILFTHTGTIEVENFIDELQVMKKLQHPNILEVSEVKLTFNSHFMHYAMSCIIIEGL